MIGAFRTAFRTLEHVSPTLASKLAVRLFFRPFHPGRPQREEPWAAKGTRTTIEGCAAWRFGTGPSVLLVHGWGGRGLQWHALIDPILEAGYQAVAIDLPAHGESPGTETSFVHAGEKLVEVLATEQPIAVVAHSFGAGAMTYASQFHSVPVVFAGGPAETMDIVDNFCRMLAVGPKTRMGLLARAMKKTGKTLEEVHVGNMASRATAPALAIQDPEDSEVSFAAAEAIMSRWPGSEHRALEGVGHYRIVWKPEAVAAIMGFLYSTAFART